MRTDSVNANLDQEFESDEEVIVPVIEEQLDIRTRKMETGVTRLIKTVEERDEIVNLPNIQELYDVERVPVNQRIDAPVAIRYEGDLIIVPILEEVTVLQKQLMLKEELHLRKRVVETHTQESVRLRKEHVEVERVTTDQAQ